jgi:hypothetical protein
MLTLRKNMMSNTCSQLYMCNMYNTIMKYAHMEENKNKSNVPHFFTTICARCITVVPLSFACLLDVFCFVFFWFYHFGNKKYIYILKFLQWRWEKKCKFALLRQHVFAHYEVQQNLVICNMYNTILSMWPLKKNMSNTWLQLYVQHI